MPHGAPDIAEGHAAERGACASGFSAFRDPLTDSDDANYGHRRRPSPDRRELRHGRGRVRAVAIPPSRTRRVPLTSPENAGLDGANAVIARALGV